MCRRTEKHNLLGEQYIFPGVATNVEPADEPASCMGCFKCSGGAVTSHMRLYLMLNMWRQNSLISLRRSCQKSWWHSVDCDSRRYTLTHAWAAWGFSFFFSRPCVFKMSAFHCNAIILWHLRSAAAAPERTRTHMRRQILTDQNTTLLQIQWKACLPMIRFEDNRRLHWRSGERKKRGDRWRQLRRGGDPGDAGCRGLFYYQPL